jgi:ATP phosphoribosyltransferase
VATKYPRITEKYFQEQGRQVEVIKLHGSVELAPLLNLAEAIVDLVSTGKTLRENKLVEVEEITSITSRLVANQSSYQMKSERVQEFVTALGKVVNGANA